MKPKLTLSLLLLPLCSLAQSDMDSVASGSDLPEYGEFRAGIADRDVYIWELYEGSDLEILADILYLENPEANSETYVGQSAVEAVEAVTESDDDGSEEEYSVEYALEAKAIVEADAIEEEPNTFFDGLPPTPFQDAEGYYGLKDQYGTEIVPCYYEYIAPYQGLYTIYKYKDLWGIMGPSGSILVPAILQEIRPFDENDEAEVRINNMWGKITAHGVIK